MTLNELNPEFKDNLIGTVHDSLLLLIHESKVNESVEKIVKIMENPIIEPYDFELRVPIVADVQIGDYWSEGAETLQIVRKVL